MSDLIERLRAQSDIATDGVCSIVLHELEEKGVTDLPSILQRMAIVMDEAADEIERLRGLLGRFVAHDEDARQNPLGGVSLGGLIDCRDNTGCVYQSQALADDLAAARSTQPTDDRKEA